MAATWAGELLRHIQKLAGVPTTPGLSDRALLERFAHLHDEAAFATLVGRHGAMVLAVCRRVLGHPQDAEDAFQAVFLILARKAAASWSESVGPWLYRVAYRLALRARTDAARRQRGTIREDVMPPADPKDQLTLRELHAVLDEELQRLPEGERAALVLCHLEGRTQAEAAQQLGWSVGTLRRRLDQGRERLRRRLVCHGLAPSAALAAVLVADSVSSAALPASLATATVRAAAAFAQGQAATALVSATAAALTEGGLTMMTTIKTKALLALVLLLSVLAGVGAWAGLGQRSRDNTPPPGPVLLAQAGRPEKNQKTDRPPQSSDQGPIEVRGRVVDPDGKPVPGAKLYWPQLHKDPGQRQFQVELKEQGVAGTSGYFHLELPRLKSLDEVPLSSRSISMNFLATAPGYGMGWAKLMGLMQPGEVTVHLVKDQSIRGRVLDTRGKPLAGVTVRLLESSDSLTGRLEDFLSSWTTYWPKTLSFIEQIYLPSTGTFGSTKMDQNGRFEIPGVGRDRLAVVGISGPGLAQGESLVLTRTGLSLDETNNLARQNIRSNPFPPGSPHNEPPLPPLLYGPVLDIVAGPDHPIEGTVCEAGTGKPIAGVPIDATPTLGHLSYRSSISTVTDREGRFRLFGLPSRGGIQLMANTTSSSPFLPGFTEIINIQEETSPLRVAFELPRGVLVKGRLVDRATGQGVPGMVLYDDLPDNTFLLQHHFRFFRSRFGTQTDKDGTYRLSVLPSTGLLWGVAERLAENGQPGANPFKPAAFSAEDARHLISLDSTKGGSPRLQGLLNAPETSQTQFGETSQTQFNVVKRLDLAEDAGTVTCDLFLDRGRTVTVSVQNPDGKPLSGASALGLSAVWSPSPVVLDQASCTVYAFAPSQPRQLGFFHRQRRLVGLLTIRSNEPAVVRLVPAGTITGRLLRGKTSLPMVGAMVSLRLEDSSDSRSRMIAALREPRFSVETDQNGRFRIDGLVPDVDFSVKFHPSFAFGGGSSLKTQPPLGTKSLCPGQTLDLGDIRIGPGFEENEFPPFPRR